MTAKPKPKRKTRKATVAPKAVRFQSRGPHKCVKHDNVSCQGVHPVLKRVLFPHWDYKKAQADGTLVNFPHPPPQMFASAASTRNTRKTYGLIQGSKFDTQIGSITKAIRTHGIVDLDVFTCRDKRDHFLKLKYGPSACKQKNSFRNLCVKLFPESEHALAFWTKYGFTPVSTQEAVADKTIRVGTRVDVLCCDPEGRTRVFEMKLGYEQNRSNRKAMGAPYADRMFTTHGENLLQTALTHYLYKRTNPTTQMATPILLRCDRAGAHGYVPPAWLIERFAQLLPRLRS